MSDNWLQYVPKDPAYRPSEEAAVAAAAALSAFLPQAQAIESEFKEAVTFFDPGGNWSGVLCSACGADAEAWWGDAMEHAHQRQFSDLACVAACCGATVRLDALHYTWPAAFGSYVLEAMNPNTKGLPRAQLEQLRAILGCELIEVPVHL